MLKVNELNFTAPEPHTFIRLLPTAVAIVNTEMKFLAASARWLSDHGLEENDILGNSYYDVFPGTSEYWKQIHQQVLAGEALNNPEESQTRDDGQIDWLRWEYVPWTLADGTVGGMIMHTENITEQIETALTLIEEKTRAERFLSISGTMILSLNKNGRVTRINDSGCRILGCDVSEVYGYDWFQTFIPFENQIAARTHFESVLEESFEGISQIEMPVAVRSGVSRLISWRMVPTRNPEGRSDGILCSGEDITDSRESERKFQVLSHRNETILNVAGDGIFGIDRNGLATFANPAGAQMVGYEADDLIGQPLHIQIQHTKADGSSFPAAESPIHKAALTGKRQLVNDAVFWRRDGSSFPAEYTATPISGELDTAGAVIVFRDVTQQRDFQAQLIQSSKLATLGEMATGVAHELNQPLNVIAMATANIVGKLDKGTIDEDYIRKKLDRVTAQTTRAVAIIDHMRMFGRRDQNRPDLLDIVAVIDSALGMVGEQLRLARIDVSIDAPDSCGQVLGHAVQVEQVLLNLLANARDALEANQQADKRAIRISVCSGPDDKTVSISVADNAGGIDPNIQERVFEPFFSTKDVGKGTGLGLSISYGIVNAMNGSISVENKGDGAAFTIVFPVDEKKGGKS